MSKPIDWVANDFTDKEFEAYMKNCMEAEAAYLNSDKFKKYCEKELTSENIAELELFDSVISEALSVSRNIPKEFMKPTPHDIIGSLRIDNEGFLRDPDDDYFKEPLALSKLSIAMGIKNNLENKGE